MSKKHRIPTFIFGLAIFGALQFLILTSLAMYVYPGGTIHHPNLESYSFLYNYFSDLGRTRLFNGGTNLFCHYLFKTTLTIAGLCVMLFFLFLPTLFYRRTAFGLSLLVALLGIYAGWCYIGIGWIPWDVSYWGHIGYVKSGFLAFLGMSILYTMAIFSHPDYPNRYAYVFLFFTLILGIQVVIMLFGPRAYRSNDALFLQAVAQKVVVYAEICCMLWQAYGAWYLYKKLHLGTPG